MDYVDRNLEETHLPFTIPMGQDISFAKIFEKYISETQKIGQNTCCLNENSARLTTYFLHWVPRRILSAAAAAALTLCKLTPRWRRWLRLTGVRVADRRRPILTLQAQRCSQLWTGKIIRKTSVFSFNKIRENSAK